MKALSLAAFLLLLSALVSRAQVPSPSPTPPDDDRDVVKISTNLIQVDVTVTDKNGKVITDLRRDEIEIYENGQKQDISNFSFISSVREITERPRDSQGRPIALPPSTLKPEQVRRTIALIVDDLTLSFESTAYVRFALKKFVDQQMMDGDLVAIIRTGAGIGALQQFTSDRRQLYAAIENVKWNPTGAGGIGAFAPLEARMPGDEEEEDEPGMPTNEGRQREFNDFRTSIFATGTLGAINYVVRGMAELPGRKSVMLLSDGFKLFTRDRWGSVESTRTLDALRRLVDQANRASVVVYTMDARGLQVGGLTAADNTGGRTPEQIMQAESDRREELRETQDGLRYLARQTGGLSIINNNDLSGGIRRILDDQSYYLVGYEPDAETFDPKLRRFNRLDVRVLRPGARVRYRSGFFGVADTSASGTPLTGTPKLLNALTSPFAVNEISLRLNALFGTLPAGGPIIRSLLHIPANDLTFVDEPDGSRKATFDVLAVGFGNNGVVVDQVSKTYSITMKKDAVTNVPRKGFVYDVTFPMKKPGAYQLRVALRDHASDKVGSASQFIEVPNLKNKRLTLSSIALENVQFEVWQRRNKGLPDQKPSDPVMDTSLRRFKRGSVLSYGFSIYNPKLASGGKPSLTAQVRLFRDGKQIFEGSVQAVTAAPAGDYSTVGFAGSLALAEKMALGEYVMQVIVNDALAKEKRRTANQFIQFELVD